MSVDEYAAKLILYLGVPVLNLLMMMMASR